MSKKKMNPAQKRIADEDVEQLTIIKPDGTRVVIKKEKPKKKDDK